MTRHSRPRTVTIAIAVAGLVGALSTAPAAGARTHRASVRVHIPRTAVTSATSPAGCTSVSKADGGTWTCTFDEEFDGTGLDRTKWSPVATAQTGVMGGAACFVDSADNVAVGGGALSLTVRKLSKPLTCRSGRGTRSTSYTGGQVGTVGKFSQTYGRFAVRAKFPASTVAGLQSSLWLWPQNNVATGLTGEIDIAEEYSRHADRIIPCLHYPYDPATLKVASTNPLAGTNVYTNNFFLVKDVNAFHEYAVEWNPGTITIFVDGQVVLSDRLATLGASPFGQPFFVALSGALGLGDNAVTQRTQLPATTQVDWVRVWK